MGEGGEGSHLAAVFSGWACLVGEPGGGRAAVGEVQCRATGLGPEAAGQEKSWEEVGRHIPTKVVSLRL